MIVEEFDRYFEEFSKKVKHLTRLGAGMQKSELFAFYALCRMKNIQLIIESGVAYGFSTEVLHTTLDIPVIGIDTGIFIDKGENVFDQAKARLAKYPDITLHTGDGMYLLPKLIREHENKRIAVLIDGPKSFYAAALAGFVANWCDLIGLHDAQVGHSRGTYIDAGDAICHHWGKGSMLLTRSPGFKNRYSPYIDDDERDTELFIVFKEV